MNTLSLHIENLLLTHHCVVVPQFGAFLTMDCAASRVEAEELFFPPLRMVRFNPDVTEDDGLLVESIRTTRHVSQSEAKRCVQKMVLDLRGQLLSDGQADFGSLGIFAQDDDGHLTFSACQAGAVTPEYFGLDAFSMPLLSSLQSHLRLTMTPESDENSDADTKGHITIRISRKAIRYVAATAAVLALGFIFSMSLNQQPNASNEASLLPRTATEVTAAQPTQSQLEKTAAPVTAEATATTPQPEAVAEAATEHFCIVLASRISEKRAERYVADLHERGFNSARVFTTRSQSRVIIGNFDNENEAYAQKARLSHQSREFAEAWVMKL